MIFLRRVGPEIHGELRLHSQKVAPFHRPVIRKLIAFEQAIDEDAPLAGILIAQELLCFLRRWQRADDIQISPPDKRGIGAGIGRRDFEALELRENEFVDPIGGLRNSVAFEWIDCAGGHARDQQKQEEQNRRSGEAANKARAHSKRQTHAHRAKMQRKRHLFCSRAGQEMVTR